MIWTTLLPYLCIPLISGAVGWFTNWIAIKMTFYPVRYFGIPPFGWQGIIPAKTPKIASKAVDLLTTKLISLEDQFNKLEPSEIEEEMRPSLIKLSRDIVDEVFNAEIPEIWNKAPIALKEGIYQRAESYIPGMLKDVMTDMQQNLDNILDIHQLTLDAMKLYPDLMNEIFIKCGGKEFKFIEQSGFYFGFLFGLIQMCVVYMYNPWWMNPVFGIIVGYMTNWLALYLIFEPKKPIKIGPFILHGLFLKRQQEVAVTYSEIIAKRILTTKSIFDYIVRGNRSDNFKHIIETHLNVLIDQIRNIKEITALEPTKKYIDKHINIIKSISMFKFMEELFIAFSTIFPYAEKKLQVREVLQEKLSTLPYKDFEGILRPAFQEDETTLIIIGGILGGVAGLIQNLIFF